MYLLRHFWHLLCITLILHSFSCFFNQILQPVEANPIKNTFKNAFQRTTSFFTRNTGANKQQLNPFYSTLSNNKRITSSSSTGNFGVGQQLQRTGATSRFGGFSRLLPKNPLRNSVSSANSASSSTATGSSSHKGLANNFQRLFRNFGSNFRSYSSKSNGKATPIKPIAPANKPTSSDKIFYRKQELLSTYKNLKGSKSNAKNPTDVDSLTKLSKLVKSNITPQNKRYVIGKAGLYGNVQAAFSKTIKKPDGTKVGVTQADHVLPFSSYPKASRPSKNKLPAVVLPAGIHQDFKTSGSSHVAKDARNVLRQQIQKGNYRGALRNVIQWYAKGATNDPKKAPLNMFNARVRSGLGKALVEHQRLGHITRFDRKNLQKEIRQLGRARKEENAHKPSAPAPAPATSLSSLWNKKGGGRGRA